jgi:hypothetical protein
MCAPETRESGFPACDGKKVADGTRTRDHRDHNPGLYQLSYRHREPGQDSGATPPTPRRAEARSCDYPPGAFAARTLMAP